MVVVGIAEAGVEAAAVLTPEAVDAAAVIAEVEVEAAVVLTLEAAAAAVEGAEEEAGAALIPGMICKSYLLPALKRFWMNFSIIPSW